MIKHVFIFLELIRGNMVNTIFKKYLNLQISRGDFDEELYHKKKNITNIFSYDFCNFVLLCI